MEENLQHQIEDLRNVIAWSKEHGGLNAGQRIVIHQQISRLLNEEPRSCVGGELQEKVEHIQKVIKFSKWQKQEIKY